MDLAYLERFCKGDRSRMERYVDMYLRGAPALYEDLKVGLANADGDGLARAAHSLRPQVNYMGATALLDRLKELEEMARSSGPAGCAKALNECLAMNERLMAELGSWMQGG